MKLNLKRPLAFFDIETTGTNIGTDRIIEIAVIKLNPDGSEEVKTWRVNPGMPISLESSMITGIYDEHLRDEPLFHTIGQDIADFIADSDLAGYNSNKFDIPMLMEEFLRTGVKFDLENRHFVDVQNIFHQMEQRTLKAAYQFYCNKNIVNAHSAEADTRATMEVLLAQVEKYQNAEWEDKKGNKSIPVVNDVEALHRFTNLNKPVDFAGRMVYNDNGEEIFNFGKHKGKRVEDVFNVEPSYYSWILQGDFPLYTKRKIEEIYSRWMTKKSIERQAKPTPPKPAINKPAEAKKEETPVPKQEYAEKVNPVRPRDNQPKKDFQKNNQQQANQPNHQHNKPFRKKEDDGPVLPVNEDMLKLLADKFKKG
jgi:DNA polymerase-3 subunit epsilon